LQQHYPAKLRAYWLPALLWALWMAGWAVAPAQELIWPPLKWVFLVLFAPIGVILLGALTGYRIELRGEVLRVGFFPFRRRFRLEDLREVRQGGAYTVSLWWTDDAFTLVTRHGESISVPCRDAGGIVAALTPHLLPQR